MRSLVFMIMAAAPSLLPLNSAAQAGPIRAPEQVINSPEGGSVCKVQVDRSQPSGTFDVIRQVVGNGDCTCLVRTGPASQPGGVESSVKAVIAGRQCSSARTQLLSADDVSGGGGGSGAGGGGSNTLPLVGAGVIAGTGVVVAATSGDDSSGDDSPGG